MNRYIMLSAGPKSKPTILTAYKNYLDAVERDLFWLEDNSHVLRCLRLIVGVKL